MEDGARAAMYICVQISVVISLFITLLLFSTTGNFGITRFGSVYYQHSYTT